jgi:hypothetical protein
MTNLLPTLPLNLSIDDAAKVVITPVGVIMRQPIVLVDIMPDGGMSVDLIEECTEQHVLFGPILHAKQAAVPFMKERHQIVVAHLKALEHAVVIHPNVGRIHIIVPVNQPEELPPLHQHRPRGHFALSQRNLQL